MASGSVAECLQQETTCPVCLQYFAEPMMLDCGHNICCACLARCWGAAETNVSCPQCRETFPQRHMRPNRHLANVTQLVKQLRTERPSGPGGEMGVCEKHREPLKLYCEQDQMPICVVCDRSREHRGHSVLPLEEAVEGFKVGGQRGRASRGASRVGRREDGEPDVGPTAVISSRPPAAQPRKENLWLPSEAGGVPAPTPSPERPLVTASRRARPGRLEETLPWTKEMCISSHVHFHGPWETSELRPGPGYQPRRSLLDAWIHGKLVPIT